MRKCGLLLFGAMLAGSVNATTINGLHGGRIDYTTGGATITDGSGVTYQGRNWETPSTRAAQIAERIKAPIGGNTLDLTVRRTIPALAMVRAAAGLAGRVLPAIALGVKAWEMLDGARIHPDGHGGLALDEGQPPADVSTWRCGSNGPTGNTPYAACYPVFQAASAGKQILTAFSCTSNGAGVTSVSCSGNWNEPGYGNYYWTTVANAVVVQQCAAVVDFENPSYSTPAGAPGPDGKCATGRYTKAMTDEEAAARVEQYRPPTTQQLNDLGEEILNKGGTIPGASERTVSGPASVTGTPQQSSTTNPDGTQKTETKTPVTNYTYNDNRISYTTTVTTTINNNGQTTVTNEDKTPQESDQCKLHPESVACQNPDTPDGPEKPTKDIQVTVTPDGGWGGDGGACPAPISTTVLGMPVVVDNSLFCQFLSGIRFAVVGACGIAAALIFMGAFKGN